MWLILALLALILIILVAALLMRRKFSSQINQLQALSLEQKGQLQDTCKDNQLLTQRVADLEYQLRESKKDLAAVRQRIENRS